MNSSLHPVITFGLRMTEAIKYLRLEGHKQATLILIYSMIDTLAWLSTKEEVIGNQGFKAWVDTYMLAPNGALLAGATATDLWGARCGLLHTNAPESKDFFDRKARKIFYISNNEELVGIRNEIIHLSLESFGQALACSLVLFSDALKTDPDQDVIARQKLDRMLFDKPLT